VRRIRYFYFRLHQLKPYVIIQQVVRLKVDIISLFFGSKINYLWILTRNYGPEVFFSRILIGGLAR